MRFNRQKISWKSNRGIVFGGLLLPAAIALTAFGVSRYKTNPVPIATTKLANPTAATAMMVQSNPSTPQLDAEHITLRETGFEPNEITRPAGRFLLAVDNLTGKSDVSLRLMHEGGARLRDLPKGRAKLRQVVDLAPGRYALVEANHPGWICRFTITAP